jgi:DNA-binding transcriptional LysR family regulator
LIAPHDRGRCIDAVDYHGRMDLRKVDLNLLVAFDALISEGNVTRAADRLGIGQSAMSSTLGRLRKLLDDPVLVREGRGLVATPLAESLLEPVRAILADVEQVLSQGRTFNPATDARTFTVLITNYHLALTFMHPLLASLAVSAPHVRLHIEPTGGDFADRLRRHEADLLIIPRESYADYRLFPHKVLYRDGYVVMADRYHPDIGDEISYEQFCTLPYIATWTGHERSYVESQLDLTKVPRNVEIVTEYGIAPFLLRGTRFITVIHERLAAAIGEQTQLKLLKMPIELPPMTETMIWTTRTDRDPAHQWLRRRLADLATQIAAAGRA